MSVLTSFSASSAVTTVLVGVVVYGLVKFAQWYSSFHKIAKEVKKIPGLPRHWLYGNLHQHPGFSEEFLEWTVGLVRKDPRIFSFFTGPFKCLVVLNHPDTVKMIMKTSEPKPIGFNGPYNLLMPWLGEGLLVASGDKHLRNRKLLTPAFHFDVLKPYIKVYNDSVGILLDKFAAAGKEESQDVYFNISLCTLDIILKCAFTYDDNIQGQGRDHPYVNAVLSLSTLILERVFYPWLYWDFLYYLTPNGRKFKKLCNFTHEVAYNIINQRKKTLEEEKDKPKKRYLDFLDILLSARDEDGKGLTDEEIRAEVDTFLFEGHDTTASGISWTLQSLADHPEIQQNARDEVCQLLEGRSSNELEWNDLGQLPYLTQCIKEAMRLHTPVPFISRQLTKEMEIDGYKLQPGTMTDVLIYNIHHNPQVWGEDHMEYKPERFDPENIKNMDPHAFIPFSAGPRNCIGQNFAMNEEKVLIARIIHRFVLEVDPERRTRHKPELVMRPENGMYLKLTPRY